MSKSKSEDKILPGELRVLLKLVTEKNIKQAAAKLFISPTTAYSHLAHAYERNHVDNPLALYKIGIEQGLVPVFIKGTCCGKPVIIIIKRSKVEIFILRTKS